MDAQHFDDLLRGLSAASRRGVLAGITGGLLAMLPIAFDGEDAAGRRKKKKKQKERCDCPKGQICVNDTCVTGAGTCAAGATTCGRPSNAPLTCNNSPSCVCRQSASGQTRCGKDPLGEACGQCTTDAQCESFGVGAFCVISTTNTPGVFCSCATPGQGFCQLPC